MESLLFLVPARGGSKGLPGKNARTLGDLPLLGWTAESVRASGIDARLWLSTDDEEIAAVGRSVGMEVPFLRPEELSSDTAGAVDVALHALDAFSGRHGTPRLLFLLQPTSPFRPPAALRFGVDALATCDAVLGVKPIHRSLRHLYRADDQGVLHPLDASADTVQRRQDVESLYTPNGALYGIRSEVLRRDRTFVPTNTRAHVMDAIASLDIDDPTDWAMAEAIAHLSWRG